jgi:hypothetical protein
MAKGPSAWINHLKSWTATKSKSNPKYTYRDAMSDPAAKAEYNKHKEPASSSSSSKSHKKGKKGKKMRGGDSSLANAASVNDSGLLLGGDDMASAPAKGGDVAATAPATAPATATAQQGGKKSRRRKGTKGKKSKKCKSKRRKSRSSRK